ncbi:hemerythrin domain-containing protein [Aquabacterium humicola]|uniref:hemerythrin domain-containing protein n=1 Tax=Aquabacterium humicola TaxID=3237377 RepID=UPI0025432B22|nr:hemerythrin domain-containing protein [Rubrivivax pictus]
MPQSHATPSTTTRRAPARARSTSTKTRAKPADAIALLKADHAEVKKLFEAYDRLHKDEASAGQRQELAQQICRMLEVHATIEEELLYPAAREALGEPDLIDEAEVEHASAKALIAELKSMQPDEPMYDAKVKVLGEYVTHHVKEEEKEMFPKLRKQKMDLKAVGLMLAQRKDELESPME